jgi:predicted phosphohydrolase
VKIFAIADLHLSFDENIDKPMNKFGPGWEDHPDRLKSGWEKTVSDEDIVLIPGDISWGLRIDEAIADFDWIHSLPGTKLLSKGNHDLWWTSHRVLDLLYGEEIEEDNGSGHMVKKILKDPKMNFVHNEAYMIGDLAICGTRGWNCPGTEGFGEHDQKIYARELLRLRASLEDGKKRGAKEIIGVLHYPPTNDKHQVSGFTELMSEYGVKTCVYGHLHGKEKFRRGIKGVLNGVEYKLVSLDYLDARPLRLI